MLVCLATKHLPSSHSGSGSVLECPAMPRLGAGSGAGDARDGRNAEDKKERGRRGRRREQCEELGAPEGAKSQKHDVRRGGR